MCSGQNAEKLLAIRHNTIDNWPEPNAKRLHEIIERHEAHLTSQITKTKCPRKFFEAKSIWLLVLRNLIVLREKSSQNMHKASSRVEENGWSRHFVSEENNNNIDDNNDCD